MITVPHIPATCPRCLAICCSIGLQSAGVVLRLLTSQPLNDAHFYIPDRVPLCEQASLKEVGREVELTPAE